MSEPSLLSDMSHFPNVPVIEFEGSKSKNPFAFKHYNPDEVVLGKRMEDHLRFAVAYWHSFAWPGGDPFGGQTFERPWFGETMDHARLKADAAFEMYDILGVPFYAFHDADARPEGATFAESKRNLDEIVDYLGEKQASHKTQLLWGTANMFSHRRYMSGAATNPDPDVFAFAAATVKTCIDATHSPANRQNANIRPANTATRQLASTHASSTTMAINT